MSTYLRAPGSSVLHLVVWGATEDHDWGLSGRYQPLCGDARGQRDALRDDRTWRLAGPWAEEWPIPGTRICKRCAAVARDLVAAADAIGER